MPRKSVTLVGTGVLLGPTEGTWLVTRRRPDIKNPNLWEFPGGKAEPSELPHDTVKREMHEELGLRVEVVRLLTVFGQWREVGFVSIFAYILRAQDFSIILTDHDQYMFATVNQIANLTPTMPSTRYVLDALRSGAHP